MVKFIVATTQRSGSRFLGTVLNSHPQIFCYPEILLETDFNEEYNFYHFYLEKTKQDNSNITYNGLIKSFDSYLSYIFTSIPQKKAIGIDIKYDQFKQIPDIIAILKKHEVKVIHLIRKNILKTHISNILNRKKHLYNRNSHGKKKVPPVKINIKPDHNLINEIYMRNVEINKYKKLLSMNFSYLEIYYEDFFDSSFSEPQTIRPPVLDKIYNFLELEDIRYDLKTDLKKTNPNNLRELIENYEEISRFLSKTKWYYLLDEKNKNSIISKIIININSFIIKSRSYFFIIMEKFVHLFKNEIYSSKF